MSDIRELKLACTAMLGAIRDQPGATTLFVVRKGSGIGPMLIGSGEPVMALPEELWLRIPGMRAETPYVRTNVVTLSAFLTERGET
jgi:hypothetical protein